MASRRRKSKNPDYHINRVRPKQMTNEMLLHEEAQVAHAIQRQLRAAWYERNDPFSPFRPVAS